MNIYSKQNSTFQRITEAYKRHTLSFFVGAGISKLSNAPSWSELINAFCDELNIKKKEKYSNDDYLSIPQKYYYHINKDDKQYYKFINSCFNCKELKPNIIHYLMCCLKPCSFITTNFDNLIEKSVMQNCLSYKSIASDTEIGTINGENYILKVHGDLDHNNIVLKEEDYLNYSENFKLTETLLKSIFSTNTVVFIGYGLNDYNIKLILNWAKFLLQDKFNTPIFIYTDNEELTDIEIRYQESRGLDILDFRTCMSYTDNKESIDFLDRYKCVLETILNYKNVSNGNIKKIVDFEMLYDLISPLDFFKTLRISDVKNALNEFIYVMDNGDIETDINEVNKDRLSYFIELLENSIDINPDIKEKFLIIKSVFKKAHCRVIGIENKIYEFDYKFEDFADLNCILFDYEKMEQFINKNLKSLSYKYVKAYYLAKLKRYKESLDEYSAVAQEAFKKNKYLLCYLSQINYRYISKIIDIIDTNIFINKKFELDEFEKMSTKKITTENIFNNMPMEFKDRYKNFSNLYSVDFLYKNACEMFIENEKLKENMNKNVIEGGLTSAGKAILRINNNLHFILGNGLYIDEFNEFQETIKYSLKLLVKKHSLGDKKILSKHLPIQGQKLMDFDEIDIYCFIEYFKPDEIHSLMKSCNIKNLPLNHQDNIDLMICNLFNYYDKFLAVTSDYYIKTAYEKKLKNCIKLLGYITISKKTIKLIFKILFKYKFKSIYLNDIILFIRSQINAGKIKPKEIRKYTLEFLLKYINDNISAINNNNKFDYRCASTGIEYWDLANYLSDNNEKFVSRELSNKIEWFIDNKTNVNLYSLYKCKKIIYKKTRKKLVKAMKESFTNSFNFNIFMNFLNDTEFVKYNIKGLKHYLNCIIEKEKNKNDTVVTISFPYEEPYTDLINVGYWCLCGYLPANEFKEFVGISEQFDFFYSPENFKYNKFSVEWIIDMTDKAYETIFSIDYVKDSIRKCICETLRNNDIEKNDKEKLFNILIKYII